MDASMQTVLRASSGKPKDNNSNERVRKSAGKYSRRNGIDSKQNQFNNERNVMTNTVENRRKTSATLGLIVCLGALPLLYGVTGCSSSRHAGYSRSGYAVSQNEATSFVGPAGPQGPSGPAGSVGGVGATGNAGAGIAGPAGEQGPQGPMGVQGAVGATGVSGYVERGPTGEVGPVGPQGGQGYVGNTGSQGASAVGSVGPAGPAGPVGPQGPTGDMGAQGPTLVGPSGPSGSTGVAGAQGVTGDTGAQGSTTVGVMGATGRPGEAGPQGPVGSTGAQGAAGIVNSWTLYRVFWFDSNADGIRSDDTKKASEIAAYVNQNPSLQIGIDTFVDANNQDLRDRRVNAVRNALVQAGVPVGKIGTGGFGAPNSRRYARVEVLLKTSSNYTASQYEQLTKQTARRSSATGSESLLRVIARGGDFPAKQR